VQLPDSQQARPMRADAPSATPASLPLIQRAAAARARPTATPTGTAIGRKQNAVFDSAHNWSHGMKT